MDKTFGGTDPAAVNALLVQAAPRLRALMAESPVRDWHSRVALATAAAACLLGVAGREYRRTRPTADQREGLEMALGVLLTSIDHEPDAPRVQLTPDRRAVDSALGPFIASASTVLASELRDDDLGNLFLGGAGILVGDAALALVEIHPTRSGPQHLGSALRLVGRELFPDG